LKLKGRQRISLKASLWASKQNRNSLDDLEGEGLGIYGFDDHKDEVENDDDDAKVFQLPIQLWLRLDFTFATPAPWFFDGKPGPIPIPIPIPCSFFVTHHHHPPQPPRIAGLITFLLSSGPQKE